MDPISADTGDRPSQPDIRPASLWTLRARDPRFSVESVFVVVERGGRTSRLRGVVWMSGGAEFPLVALAGDSGECVGARGLRINDLG